MKTFLLKMALLVYGMLAMHLVYAQTAAFTINGTNGFCKGTTVTFSNTSTGASTYLWDFGDGSQSTQPTPAHVFAQPGTYLVTLTAQQGTSSQSVQHAVYIRDYPSANFNLSTGGFAGNKLPGEVIKPIDFSTGSVGYYWSNGAGFVSTQPRISFAYATPGNYTVSLTTHNGCGDSSTYTQTVTVLDTNSYTPQATGYVSPMVVCPGSPVQFSSYTDTYTALKWIMGDGSSFDNQESLQHAFAQKGTYRVALVAYYHTRSDTSFFDVLVTDTALDRTSVYAGIQPQQYDPNTSTVRYLTCVGSPFTFTGAYAAELVKHTWKLPNGVQLQAKDTQYAFGAVGDYPLVYQFENRCGVRDSLLFVLQVRTADSIAANYLTMNVNAGPSGVICPGNTAFFSTYGSDASAIKWVFHDGSTVVNRFDASKQYTTPGTYDVKLIVQTGCRKDSLVRSVVVSGTAGSVSDMSIINSYNAATPLCAGDSVYAFADSNTYQTYKSVSITAHTWYSGDGAVYHTPLFAHRYAAAGWHSIIHETVNSCGQRSATARTVWVNTNAVPVANFYLPQQAACAGDSVMIDQFSSKADSIVIRMGDGHQLLLNREHFFPHLWYVYPTPGSYTVRLYAYNTCGVDSAVDHITILALPEATIQLSDTLIQTGTTLTIGAGLAGSVKHTWRYGRAAADTSSANTLTRTFGEEGVFTVYLETMNAQGCSAMDSVRITVSNHAALAEQVGGGVLASVYPNPASSDITVELVSTAATPCGIELLQLDGRLIHRQEQRLVPGTTTVHVPIDYLQAGMYLVRMYTQQGVRTVKVVKQ